MAMRAQGTSVALGPGGLSGIILHEGWVLKKSAHLGDWRRRWLVLFTDDHNTLPTICYFKQQRVEGGVGPEAARYSLVGSTCTESGAREHAFTLRFQVGGSQDVPSSRKFDLAAPTAAEQRQWIQVVAEALEETERALHGPSGLTPVPSRQPSLRVEDPVAEEPEPHEHEHPSLADRWTASAWLSSLGVADWVGAGLLGGHGSSAETDELAALRALGEDVTSEAALADHLRAAGLIEKIASALLPSLRTLRSATVHTGRELHSKFVLQADAITLKYGDLSTFFGGLEAKIGAPNPKIRQAMEHEHTASADSDEVFTSSNYLVDSTPAEEFWFVVEPHRRDDWPAEKALRAGDAHRRVVLAVDELLGRLADFNERLRSLGEPELILEEGFGARLYTGPMFVKCTHAGQDLRLDFTPLRPLLPPPTCPPPRRQ
jgi:hypothetical protein